MNEPRPVHGCSWLSNIATWEPEWNLFIADQRFKMVGFRILLRRSK